MPPLSDDQTLRLHPLKRAPAAGVAAALVLLLTGCLAAPVYEGPRSGHFDGTRFHNGVPNDKSLADIIALGASMPFQAATWDKPAVTPPAPPVPERRTHAAVTYINHATTLIQVDGLNILTDPVFSERVSPFSWWGPKRIMPPAIPLEKLPPIDVILVSHNHYDHLDLPSLLSLQSRQADQPPLILAGLGNSALLHNAGLKRVKEMDWEDTHRVATTQFVFTEARHRSGRGFVDQMRTLWGAFVIKSTQGNIYFAGDTAYGPHFIQTGKRHGPISLALLPIGAYEPRWFMQDIHLNPDDAVQAHQDLRSQQSVGIHFGFFQLTAEGLNTPAADLQKALAFHRLDAAAFHVPYSGEEILLHNRVTVKCGTHCLQQAHSARQAFRHE